MGQGGMVAKQGHSALLGVVVNHFDGGIMVRVLARSRQKALNALTHPGILFVFLLMLAMQTFAGQASLVWNPSTSPAVAGYMLYYGQVTGNYTNKVDVGNVTSYSASALLEGKTYYYVVTAYDSSRAESTYSNEVSATVPYVVPASSFSASTTSGASPLAVSFASNSSGVITAYSWTFGDGTSSTSATPSHSYATPGTYSVSLTVTGPGGTSTVAKPSYITVSAPTTAPPVANFTLSTTSGTAPVTVTFTSTSTGTIGAFAWTFGDGTNSTAQNPSHSYASAGTYPVQLTVNGPGGSSTKSSQITVSAPISAPPTANFAADRTTGNAPLVVSFASNSAGSIAAYTWTFGDGSTSSLASPSHSYSAAGTYTVSLKVTGPNGSNTLTKTNYITVSQPSASTGSLAGSVASSSAAVDLTVAGTVDWAHWPGYNHKASGDAQISNYTRVGSGSIHGYSNDPRTLSWSDGINAVSGSNRRGLYVAGTGNGFQLNAPADTTTRTLTVYVGGSNSAGKLTAHLSDGSTADYGNTTVSGSGQYNGVYRLTYQAASAGQRITVNWTQASGSGNVTLQGATLAAAAGSPTPGTDSCPCTLWSSTTAPALPADFDTAAVELGLQFKADSNGWITGVRFHKPSTNTGTHVGSLWSSSGKLLAQATFVSETASGWQQVDFATPVAITADTVYVASYHTNVGHYSADNAYFATSGVDRGPLHALQDGVSGGNGVYAYNANPTFPGYSYLATNYWVDVVFTSGR